MDLAVAVSHKIPETAFEVTVAVMVSDPAITVYVSFTVVPYFPTSGCKELAENDGCAFTVMVNGTEIDALTESVTVKVS
jgi:hypothetical protein